MCNQTKNIVSELSRRPDIDFMADANKHLIAVPSGSDVTYLGRNSASYSVRNFASERPTQ